MQTNRKRLALFVVVALSALLLLVACGGVSQEDLDAVQAELASAQAAATTAAAERDQAVTDLEAAETDLEAAETDLEAAETDLSSEQDSATRLRGYLSSAAADLASVSTELASVSEELAAALLAGPEEAGPVSGEAYGYVHPAELSVTGEYVNAEFGFSVMFDTTWTDTTEEGGHLAIAEAGVLTGAYTGAAAAADYSTLAEMVVGEFTESEAEIVQWWTTTLSDGTPAFAVQFNVMMTGYDMEAFLVGLVHGDNWVYFGSWNTAYEDYGLRIDLIEEMAHSLLVQAATDDEVVEEEVVEDGDAVAGSLEPTTFDYLTYTDETYGFTITYDAGWVSEETYGAYERLADAAQWAVPSISINPEGFENTDDGTTSERTEDHRATIVGDEEFDAMISETAGVLVNGTAVMIYEYSTAGDYPGTNMEMVVDIGGTQIQFVVAEQPALAWAGVDDWTASALELLLSLDFTVGADADADAVVEEVVLSFEAETYTNEEYGFSIQYPASWPEGPLDDPPDQVFTADAPACCPGLTVYVPDDEGLTAPEGLEASMEDTDFVNVGEVELTLADGSTTTAVWSTWTDIYDFDMVTIWVPLAGGKMVRFNVWQIQAFGGAVDAALYEEILSTLLIE